MTKLTLTPQQREVVQNRGGSLLVSAAAGSGKTKVLVERLFLYVTEEHYNIDDFLIITYTKAAAAELRGKIASELSKRLAEAPGTPFETAAFAGLSGGHQDGRRILHGAFERKTPTFWPGQGDRHALTPDFRVLDESEARLVRQRVLNRTLERFYDELNPGRGAAGGHPWRRPG